MKKRDLLSVILLFLLSACARQVPWQSPLAPEETEKIQEQILLFQKQKSTCPQTIQADIAAKWDAPLQDGGMTGILQIVQPSSLKLVAVNPLSQPLYALTLDGIRFQALDVPKGRFHYGKTSHFLQRYDLPKALNQKKWVQWLTARSDIAARQITGISKDSQGRGYWVEVTTDKIKTKTVERILFDLSNGRVLEQRPFDRYRRKIATITYRDWTGNDICALPQSISISDTLFNTDISVELSNVKPDAGINKKDLFLKSPPGFLRKFYP